VEEVERKSLTKAMAQTTGIEASSIIGEYVELGIDALLDEGVLKEIPIVSTAVSLFKVGKSIRELHHLKKFYAFLCEFDHQASRDGARDKYRKYFESENRDEELMYLIVILDRYIEDEQAKHLAILYAAFLDEKISFTELRLLSQVLERLLPGDYEMLKSNDQARTFRETESDAIMRLVGLGLMIELPRKAALMVDDGVASIDDPEEMAKEERNYRRTALGDKLVSIVDSEAICHTE